MFISYPALFYKSPTEGGSYYIHFPDLEGPGTQGDTVEEALMLASEYLGILAAHLIENGEKLPTRSDIRVLSPKKDFPFRDNKEFDSFYDFDQSFASMVCVDLEPYFAGQTSVKKTLTIPKWANDLGNRLNLNFSRVLTEAIETIALR